jgi:hypothetical protein
MNSELAGKDRDEEHVVQKAGVSLDFSLLQFMPLACSDDLGGIDCLLVELLFQNFSILAYEEIYAAGGFVFVDINAILTGHFPAPITCQRKLNSNLVGEGFVGERAIHAHTQDLGVGGFQLLEILLEVFHLLGSTTGKGKNIKCQDDIFLAAVLV